MVLPNIRHGLSDASVQSAFFDFQRQAAGLRAQAYQESEAISLVASGHATSTIRPPTSAGQPKSSSPVREWTYNLSAPMTISAGGVCDAVDAYLVQNGEIAGHLQSQPNCHFHTARVMTTQWRTSWGGGQPGAPLSMRGPAPLLL